jgi:hypothetical protein
VSAFPIPAIPAITRDHGDSGDFPSSDPPEKIPNAYCVKE